MPEGCGWVLNPATEYTPLKRRPTEPGPQFGRRMKWNGRMGCVISVDERSRLDVLVWRG